MHLHRPGLTIPSHICPWKQAKDPRLLNDIPFDLVLATAGPEVPKTGNVCRLE